MRRIKRGVNYFHPSTLQSDLKITSDIINLIYGYVARKRYLRKHNKKPTTANSGLSKKYFN